MSIDSKFIRQGLGENGFRYRGGTPQRNLQQDEIQGPIGPLHQQQRNCHRPRRRQSIDVEVHESWACDGLSFSDRWNKLCKLG